MTALKISGGIVGALALLFVISGATSSKSHVASVKATFVKPTAELWQRITDHASQTKWRGDLKSATLLPPHDGKPAFEEESDFGKVQYVVDEAVPMTRYVTRITSEGLGYSGRWIFELAPVAAGTTLTITEEGEVQSFFFRAMSPLFSKTQTIEKYLAALAKELGVSATPEVVRAK